MDIICIIINFLEYQTLCHSNTCKVLINILTLNPLMQNGAKIAMYKVSDSFHVTC